MIKELITFDGGLSTKRSEHLISNNEGIICQNVDLEKGTLSPLPSLKYLTNIPSKHIYSFNTELIYGASDSDDRFFNEYGGRLYWSDDAFGSYGLMRYDGTNAGVNAESPNPLDATTEVKPTLSNDGIQLHESSAIEGFLTDGADYIYAFTIVDADSIESIPVFKNGVTITSSKSSMELKVAKTLMATISTNHPDMVGINIYRSGGDNPTFNLVAELMSPTHPEVTEDATYYYWYDTTADINVSRIELTTFENTPPPDRLDMLIEVNGTMWGSNGKKVYFNKTGSPEYWGALDYVVLDKDCTGIGKFGDNVVAFTKTSSYLISGYNRDNVVVNKLPYNQGCVNKRTITNVGEYLLWTSINGICMFDGSNVQVLTRNTLAWDEFGRIGNTTYDDFNSSNSKWDSGEGFNITYATNFQDKYYGIFNDGCVVIDLSNGLKVSTIYLPNVASVSVNQEDNILYFMVLDEDTSTYDVYYLANGSEKMTATWKTGKIVGESNNIKKHYRQVELDGEPVSVSVYVDGILKYTSEGKSKFMLPAGLIGRDIQFEINTINEIRSLKYQFSTLQA